MQPDESNEYIKNLESMNENEIIHPSLIRPIAKLSVPKNIGQFRLLDDPDSDNWNDCEMNEEKVTLYQGWAHFFVRGLKSIFCNVARAGYFKNLHQMVNSKNKRLIKIIYFNYIVRKRLHK